jgi:peptidyl-prolyl cis-trans isomerase C
MGKFSWLALSIIVLTQGLAIAQTTGDQSGGDVLATVGNQKITREMLDNIIGTIPEENRIPFLTPDGRKKILDEVVNFELFARAAKDSKIESEPAIKTRLQYEETQYLAREYFRREQGRQAPVSEDSIKDFYSSHLKEFAPPEEIQARHILVKTEVAANKIIEELKNGADFAELAKKKSIDPAAQKGGKLELMDGKDWLPRGSFEKSFEHVLFKIPKGQTGGPVKSQFGWHILKVDDRRQPEPPSFVQVRSMIKSRLENERNSELHKKVTDDLKAKIPVVIK